MNEVEEGKATECRLLRVPCGTGKALAGSGAHSSSNQAAGKHCGRMCLGSWGDEKEGGWEWEEKEEAGKRGWIPSLGRGWAMDFSSSQGEGSRWERRWMCGGATGLYGRCCQILSHATTGWEGGARAAPRVGANGI